jgi:hypothetical protein
MELEWKFQDATSCRSVKIISLEVDRKYPITHAVRIVTKFGPTVLMSITDEPFDTVKVFMTKRNCSAFWDTDIDINTAKVSLYLI